MRDITKIRNLAGAAITELTAIAGGRVALSDDVVTERLEICQSCEQFDPEKSKCLKCQCFMLIKTKWRTSSCPLKKW